MVEIHNKKLAGMCKAPYETIFPFQPNGKATTQIPVTHCMWNQV